MTHAVMLTSHQIMGMSATETKGKVALVRATTVTEKTAGVVGVIPNEVPTAM
jgi:hypothetical protein